MEFAQSRQSPGRHEIDIPLTQSKEIPADRLRVLSLQRTCVYDGPGIRTVIFFKGCALRCLWCQNPEALSYKPDIAPDGGYSIADIMDVVSRDREYYAATGGGVTLSGGDPLLQDRDSLVLLLESLKREAIRVAIETSLHAPWDTIAAVAPYVDRFLVDLKIVGDDSLHRTYTGQDGALIHGNIERLLALHGGVKFRMVMVPGFNDAERHIRAAADFLRSNGHDSIELLKYHNMYEDKARRLGLAGESLNITPEMSLAAVQRAVDLFGSLKIKAECIDLGSSRGRAVFTGRVHDIQAAIRESDHHLCFEASRLKTDFYRKHGFRKPAHIHRAERLAHVLNSKKIIVYPDELLVGNFTSKRKGGQVWEEHYGVLFSRSSIRSIARNRFRSSARSGTSSRFISGFFPSGSSGVFSGR